MKVLAVHPSAIEGVVPAIFLRRIDHLNSDDIQLVANMCGFVIYTHYFAGLWNYELNHFPIPLVNPEFDVYAGKSVSEILAMPKGFPDMLGAMRAGLKKIAEIIGTDETPPPSA